MDLMAILQALERKRVVVRILNLGLDSPGVHRQAPMLQRQRGGFAKAKSAGKCKG
jgi:hypothetical protein